MKLGLFFGGGLGSRAEPPSAGHQEITESHNNSGWKRPQKSSSPTVNPALPGPPLYPAHPWRGISFRLLWMPHPWKVSQGQFGQGLESPGPVLPKVSLPMAGGIELNNLYIPFQPNCLFSLPPQSFPASFGHKHYVLLWAVSLLGTKAQLTGTRSPGKVAAGGSTLGCHHLHLPISSCSLATSSFSFAPGPARVPLQPPGCRSSAGLRLNRACHGN